MNIELWKLLLSGAVLLVCVDEWLKKAREQHG